MDRGSVDTGSEKADEDVLAGLPAHRSEDRDADKAVLGFRVRELEVSVVDSCVEDGAPGTEDERADIEGGSGNEVIPGCETEVTVDPEEKAEEDNSDIMGRFEELVAVVSGIYVRICPCELWREMHT